MGIRDTAEQIEVLVQEFNDLEADHERVSGQLARITNVMEGPQDAEVKVSLIQKIIDGH